MADVPLGSMVRHIHEWASAPDTREQNDRTLLERFQDHHDQAAFAALVRRHGGMVWHVCRHVLGQEQDAEDAFQATFLVLVHQAGALHKIQSLAGWLHSVAYRAALRARRDLARQRAREKKAANMTPRTATEDIAWREVQAVLDEEIQRLPEKQRTVFVLCCLEGLSQAAAARQLELKEGTVSSRLAHARRRLQQRLTRRGITLSAVLGALAVAQGVRAAAPAKLVEATLSIATQGALYSSSAALSAPVAALAKGVLHTMSMARWVVIGSVLFGIGAAGTSVGVWRHSFAAAPPQPEEPPVLVARAPEAPAPKEVEDELRAQVKSVKNLKQLGLGMHAYHEVYGQFPPAAVYSKDGKPLLSWRVLILPYLADRQLFKQFKLDEPWDSPHNKKLLEKMPGSYRPARGKTPEPYMTYYQVFTGPGTIFDRAEGRSLGEITDGTSNTILIAEAAEPVPWTKPADLVYDRNKPVPRVGGLFSKGFSVVLADGSAHFLKKWNNAEEEKIMHGLIGRNDQMIVSIADLKEP